MAWRGLHLQIITKPRLIVDIFKETAIRKKIANQTRNSSTEVLDIKTPIITIMEARRFMTDAMKAAGTLKQHAEALADLLSEADYRGHYSHGMNRLEMYIRDVQHGQCDGHAKPKILKETPAIAWVDGQNGLGAVVGGFSMDLAIRKAKKVGVGWVSAKGSNHYGIAGYYSIQAINEEVLGFSCCNTSPLMTPTRAKTSAIGTNPLSLGAPGCDQESFLLDMATTAVAVGKIEFQKRKKEPLPIGWALDDKGKMTTDAEVAFKAKRLMPLGGPEISSGYKGFGLGMMVEIFCGILSGSNYGPYIRKWGSGGDMANLGQCFVAIDPKFFAPGFQGRLSDLMDYIRALEPADPEFPVLVPGDAEKMHMEAVDKVGGVRYVKDQHETCAKLVEEFKIKPLQPYQGSSKCEC